jgi:hypothetical protein
MLPVLVSIVTHLKPLLTLQVEFLVLRSRRDPLS